MNKMSLFRSTFKSLTFLSSKTFKEFPLIQVVSCNLLHTSNPNYDWNVAHLCLPKSLYNSLRRKVHYPEKYTVEPLKTTHLAGRDPVTGKFFCSGVIVLLYLLNINQICNSLGRVVVATLGGGIKHKYHWIDWHRRGPNVEGEYYIEKVLELIEDGCRTARVALVGGGDRLRYILATVNMKPGDIIKTSEYIPRAAGRLCLFSFLCLYSYNWNILVLLHVIFTFVCFSST